MSNITQEDLKSLLDYNTNTGEFNWINSSCGITKGQRAGWLENNGYWRIEIKDKKYSAHRLAWLYVTGKWPTKQIDHINGIKHDNRWCNLRECTGSQNRINYGPNKNNKLGIKGVYQQKNKFLAHIMVQGEYYHLGTYETEEEAKNIRKEAELEYFGEFAYQGD
jgi:hypothetical protein